MILVEPFDPGDVGGHEIGDIVPWNGRDYAIVRLTERGAVLRRLRWDERALRWLLRPVGP